MLLREFPNGDISSQFLYLSSLQYFFSGYKTEFSLAYNGLKISNQSYEMLLQEGLFSLQKNKKKTKKKKRKKKKIQISIPISYDKFTFLVVLEGKTLCLISKHMVA